MHEGFLDAVIIGAGHAGLSVSYFLKSGQYTHVVLERGRIGESWLSQRWDSFRLNTANKVNRLPGQQLYHPDEDGFCSSGEFVNQLASYTHSHQLPVREGCRVTGVEKPGSTDVFNVVFQERGTTSVLRCKTVIVASGGQSEKKIPAFASRIPGDILQLHASEYKNASALPKGNVLVVGSAQSGVQVVEDLLDAGRSVFFSTSMVGRVPRQYRGKDVVDWLIATGFYQVKTEDAEPAAIHMKVPQVSGVGERGHTVSLQWLAKRGAIILGKIDRIENGVLILQPNAAAHVKFGDEFSKKVKSMIDVFIEKAGQYAPPVEIDEADTPDESVSSASPLGELDLKQSGIGSVIWTTGFASDLSYLKLPALNEDGSPMHKEGIAGLDGLFFIGFPWLRSRQSGIIHGITDDATFISSAVTRFLAARG